MTIDQEQQQAKIAAEESFKRALALFEANNNFDEWARFCLTDALLAMKAGLYGVAKNSAEQAHEQPSSRARWSATEMKDFTLTDFKMRLDEAIDSLANSRNFR